ncbi:hypothetical protein ACHHYP_12911 [Achlya hypogyna]|uniref:Uncharacterized protein n=1 Tax=Achlya hypogyna TaxID=1202772 RepID=A0A1V9ZG62_ACHHY|nr:hypothetical protein ACHHYP_12911 [Achlya hypogyna]
MEAGNNPRADEAVAADALLDASVYVPAEHPVVEHMLQALGADESHFCLSLDDLRPPVLERVASVLSQLISDGGAPARRMCLLTCAMGVDTFRSWLSRYNADHLRALVKSSVLRQRESMTDAPAQLAIVLTSFNISAAVRYVRDQLQPTMNVAKSPCELLTPPVSPKKKRRQPGPPTEEKRRPMTPRVPPDGLHVLLAEVIHKYQHRALARKPQFAVTPGRHDAADAASRRLRSLSYGNLKGQVPPKPSQPLADTTDA